MSEFPTCPKHMVMKPCPHCEPSKYQPAPEVTLKVCGDVEQGDTLVRCHCGLMRSSERSHGYTGTNYHPNPYYP